MIPRSPQPFSLDVVAKALGESQHPDNWLHFQGNPSDPGYFAHKSAIIHPSAKIGRNSIIAAGVHVFEETIIGRTCVLKEGVILGKWVVLGDSCDLEKKASIADLTNVGAGCCFGAYSCVGASVSIAPNVSIGANSLLESKSTVGAYTIIGNHVRVANNITIGAGASVGNCCLIEKNVGDDENIGAAPSQVCDDPSDHPAPMPHLEAKQAHS